MKKNKVIAEIEKIKQECIGHVADAWTQMRNAELKLNKNKDLSHLIRCLEGKETPDSRLAGLINQYKLTRDVNEHIVNHILRRLRDAAMEQERQSGNVVQDPPPPPDVFSIFRKKKAK